MSWAVEIVRGDAGTFHARQLPEAVSPTVWWFEVDRPALVLGSAQDDTVVDRAACERLGVDVVRRHSGGGAVLLVPGSVIWFDVIIPAGHARWDDDVSRAAWWVGDAVTAAIGDSSLLVHRGPMQTTEWSPLVCFAGLGPGEVTNRGRKVLGLSQRRTRAAIRYQCAVHRTWEPERLLPLLREPRPALEALADLVAPAVVTVDTLLAGLGES